MAYIVDQHGNPITSENPFPVALSGVGLDGDKLKVKADIQGATIEATISGVTIQDPVTPANKQKVNADGSTVVQLSGSKVPEGIADFRLNQKGVVLASAARTASVVSPDQVNYNARGVIIMIDVTAASGTGGLVPRILAKDPIISGGYYLNAPPTPITAVGRYAFVLYPGSSGTVPTPGIVQTTPTPLPREWYVAVTHNDASSYTYSIGYSLIL